MSRHASGASREPLSDDREIGRDGLDLDRLAERQVAEDNEWGDEEPTEAPASGQSCPEPGSADVKEDDAR